MSLLFKFLQIMYSYYGFIPITNILGINWHGHHSAVKINSISTIMKYVCIFHICFEINSVQVLLMNCLMPKILSSEKDLKSILSQSVQPAILSSSFQLELYFFVPFSWQKCVIREKWLSGKLKILVYWSSLFCCYCFCDLIKRFNISFSSVKETT